MAKAYCERGNHYPEELIADGGVLLYNEGDCSNRMYDGTIGIPLSALLKAEADEQPVCAEHTDCIVCWHH